MRGFFNAHPFIALAMVCIVSASAVKVAEIIKNKSIVDAVDVIVIKKGDKENKQEEEKVESVEEE